MEMRKKVTMVMREKMRKKTMVMKTMVMSMIPSLKQNPDLRNLTRNHLTITPWPRKSVPMI